MKKRKDLRKISKEYPFLYIVETTIGMNGYPQCLKDAIVGFDNFEQAEEIAEKNNLRITTLYKRDGWQLWERNSNTTYEPLKPTAQWYGDNYNTWRGEDIESYSEYEAIPMLKALLDDDRIQDVCDLETFVGNVKEITSRIASAYYDELVVTCDGEYYDTIDAECMKWDFDTHHYIIALVDDEE